MKLEDLYVAYQALRKDVEGISSNDPAFEDKRDTVHEKMDQLVLNAAHCCIPLSSEHISWFKSALGTHETFWNHGKNWFAISVLGKVSVIPHELALFAIQMAVEEPDPSYNRHFVEPAVRGLGAYEVCQRLLEVMRTGSNYKKAGALNALYWAANLFLHDDNLRFKEGVHKNSPECREMRRRILNEAARISLVEFVATDDLDLRRSLVRWVSADETKYSEELRPLVVQAVQIALHHPDDYIRKYMERQLCPDGLTDPLPHRQQLND